MRNEMNAGITRHALGEFTFDRVDGAIENVDAHIHIIVDVTNTIPASLKAVAIIRALLTKKKTLKRSCQEDS